MNIYAFQFKRTWTEFSATSKMAANPKHGNSLLFQNGANKNQHQESHKRETIPDKFVLFFQSW